MRAEDLVQRYEAGERDFCGVEVEKEYLGLPTVDLREANLSGPDLATAGLRSANLADTNLEGADLEASIVDEADLSGTRLNNARLWKAKLCGAKVDPGFPVDLAAIKPDNTKSAEG